MHAFGSCLHNWDLFDTGGIACTELISFHQPFSGVSASGCEVDLSQPPLINPVNHLHECIATGIVLFFAEWTPLLCAFGGEVHQHDAASLHIVDIIPPDPTQQELDLGKLLTDVSSGYRQSCGYLVGV